MPIPSQSDMYGMVLGLMSDGTEHARQDVIAAARDLLGLTEEEAQEKTSSGAPVYATRVDWSIVFLFRAQLLSRVRRGVYAINDEGRSALAKGMPAEDMSSYLNERIARLNPWNVSKPSGAKRIPSASAGLDLPAGPDAMSPQERVEALAEDLNESLASELIALIMDRDPAFFERVVVDLLERMGYGHGRVTQRSADGGIDGLVTTDELGFRPICTQAKRYAPDRKVDRPTVQAFIGALNGAPNGVFITTSSFTKEAMDFADGYPNATIALIDGRHLAELMIKHDFGVATEQVIKIKRVDSDYFDEQ